MLSVNNASETLIAVGKIVAPHGVRGDLRILPDTDWPERFRSLKHIRLGGKLYRLLSARPHKNIYILHLEGVDDRNMAETLIGKTAEVPASEMPERPEGLYYDFQIAGLTAFDEAGEKVGVITEIIHTGANDVYVIHPEKGVDILLPAIPDCVLAVDVAEGRMTVRLQEWED